MTEIIDDTKSFTVTMESVTMPAKGSILSYDVPASAKHNEGFPIPVTVKNVGGSTGSFKLKVSVNGKLVATIGPSNIAAGATQNWTAGVAAPASGSMSGKIELFRMV